MNRKVIDVVIEEKVALVFDILATLAELRTRVLETGTSWRGEHKELIRELNHAIDSELEQLAEESERHWLTLANDPKPACPPCT